WRITPVVSADETESGVIAASWLSFWSVRSPLLSPMVGESPLIGAPVQSLIDTFTGSTCPLLSWSVTGWLVIGARNAPLPTLTAADVGLPEPPPLSVTLTVACTPQPPLWNCGRALNGPPCAACVCVTGSANPFQLKLATQGLSFVPGSLNEYVNVPVRPLIIGPLRTFAVVRLPT